MRKFLCILFLSVCLSAHSQQVVELCPDTDLTYTYSTTAGTPGTYVWTVNATDYIVDELTMTWTNEGVYTISVVFNSTSGCSDSTSYIVNVAKCSETLVYIPSAFTPDNDALNDGLGIKLYNVATFSLYIYNRWGEKLFQSADILNQWDGTYRNEICKQDVYVYLVQWTDLSNKDHQKYGNVLLLR